MSNTAVSFYIEFMHITPQRLVHSYGTANLGIYPGAHAQIKRGYKTPEGCLGACHALCTDRQFVLRLCDYKPYSESTETLKRAAVYSSSPCDYDDTMHVTPGK